MLNSKGVGDLQKIAVDREPDQLAIMISRTGRRSVPQIFIGEVHVGGYDDLAALDRAGQLDALLQSSGANSQ
jgi:glutaredoxin 3